ncbi:MAG: hypothetical protein HOV79_22870 [Hamadaea sp.]|nr:hypothetical protein [Hamadaea sp.]
MYAWIWRRLPGPLWARIATSVAMVVAISALLWFYAFPWAEPLLPWDDVQVGDGVTGEMVPGEDEIPYPTHTNNPDPSASPAG